jgi:hypothetical protein
VLPGVAGGADQAVESAKVRVNGSRTFSMIEGGPASLDRIGERTQILKSLDVFFDRGSGH